MSLRRGSSLEEIEENPETGGTSATSTPTTYKQAVKSPQERQWRQAMQTELALIRKNVSDARQRLLANQLGSGSHDQ